MFPSMPMRLTSRLRSRRFTREVARSDEILAGIADLDQTFRHERTGELMSVRWLLVHMIEEYARHNGHADLLREAIDGVTGE